MRLAVAISVHNKLDELSMSLRVIRERWDEQPFVAVCCNDPASIADVRKLGADVVVEGDNSIPTSPKPLLRTRQFDCIRRALAACVGNATHAMHIHADACALDGSVPLAIVTRMECAGFKVAFRGRGLSAFNAKTPYGDVDDHFLFYDLDAMANNGVFDCEPSRWLVSCNVESLLARRMQDAFTSDELWHYSDMSGNEIDPAVSKPDIYADGLNHRAMNPFNYDPDRKFLHAATLEHARPFLSRNGIELAPRGASDYLDDWMVNDG